MSDPAGSPSARKGSATQSPRGVSGVQRKFERLGLHEPADFIVHVPLRYEDETSITPIAQAFPGASVQIEATVLDRQVLNRPRRQLVATVSDATGTLGLRWLNFYPGQISQLAIGKTLRIRGEIRHGFHGPEMVHPRLGSIDKPLSNALTPVYPTTDGLAQPVLRKAIESALQRADLSETLPQVFLERYGLMPFEQAIKVLHHPPASVSMNDLTERGHPAWERIKFDELLAQQLSLAEARAHRRAQRAQAMLADPLLLFSRLRQALPFALTAAQERVIEEIAGDMRRSFPMHRLLQGDVGSGKTIVAAFAALQAIASGAQVAIMAPTEILAEQHFSKLSGWLQALGVTVVWLVGSLGAKARREALSAIEEGAAGLVVGTQALIQERVIFKRLGLVIMDEQHRFGVGQRLELNRKGERAGHQVAWVPHQINMSATPIPRTLAMTFFADLDVSVIDELPPGRTPVLTKLIADTRRDQVLGSVLSEVRQGRQVYWVCPLVEESEALQLQTAVDTHAALSQALAGVRVGLIHGKLPTVQKQQVMTDFREGNVDVLVATTVIEVGVDVPNASLMIIEHAERFGLAQLHQLRGRVGRGSHHAICVLLYQEPLSMVARQRLKAMYETTDGFEIARRDLELRGPGEFLGLRQSGQQLLRFARLETDHELVERAREAARALREHYPGHVDAHLNRWMRRRQDYLRS
ncbi:MAG: ATP-dependent DNA helicase RecG [Alcaligenaceae bacterium]|nr:ATP-dependent DNA helicase RecG [Alcaligenaceae bacterium]